MSTLTPYASAFLAVAVIGCPGPSPSPDVRSTLDATVLDAPMDVAVQDVYRAPDVPIVLGPPRLDPASVHVNGRAFRDGLGRQLLFRGYNVKIIGIFDVTFDDGRTPNETFPAFTETEWLQFEDLGFNAIRLTATWSGLEPQPSAYSQAFLAKLDETLAAAWRHGIYVLIDMHQDGYSKEIGEDGEPLWAIVPPPTMLLSGPYSDDRRLTSQVLSAGFSFFDNRAAMDGRPLQQAFISAVQVMARRTLGLPVVLGFEAFNEPVVLDINKLNQFHARFADGIHQIDRDAPVLFEPMGIRNQNDQAPIPPQPFAHGPGSYAPHIYTGWFSRPDQMGWASEDPSVIIASMNAAEAEASGWGTPLFITEFGCDVSNAHGQLWMNTVLDSQDRLLASSTAWAREPGDWGLYNGDQLRLDLARVVARSFPRAIAGNLIAIERPAPGHLHVRYQPTAATRGLMHEVSASMYFVSNVSVQCNGANTVFTRQSGRIQFACANDPVTGEASFDVNGTPVP